MTSTNIFSGIQNERNSSRVLRPPGGGQSDVLGVSACPQASPKKAVKPVTIEEPKSPKINNEKPVIKENPRVETAATANAAPRSRVPPGGFSSGGFW